MFTRTSVIETLVKVFGETQKRLETELAVERSRNAILVETIVQMKREGFHPVLAMSPAPQQDDRLPKEIDEALDELGLIGTMRAQHEAWARRQLAKDRDAAVIASELLQGGLIAEEDRGSKK